MTCGVLGSPEHRYFDCSLQNERFDRVLKALLYRLRLEGSPLRNRSVRSVDMIPGGINNPGYRASTASPSRKKISLKPAISFFKTRRAASE
jgi:hypothetical protein